MQERSGDPHRCVHVDDSIVEEEDHEDAHNGVIEARAFVLKRYPVDDVDENGASYQTLQHNYRKKTLG